jgi:hypothetical protein
LNFNIFSIVAKKVRNNFFIIFLIKIPKKMRREIKMNQNEKRIIIIKNEDAIFERIEF